MGMAKKNRETATKAISLKDWPAYAKAIAGLDTANVRLKEHLSRRDACELRIGRMSSAARSYAKRGGVPFPPMPAGDLDSIALRAIDLAGTGAEIMAKLGVRLTTDQHWDEVDAAEIRILNGERAAVEVFRRSVELLQKMVIKEKRAAMANILQATADDRDAISRSTAAAVKGLAGALAVQREFYDRLREEDPALADEAFPTAFPLAPLLGPEVAGWVRRAGMLGLVDVNAPEMKALWQLETGK